MFNPISSTVPPDCILMTRLAPKALSSTAPGTSASMVRARSMQTPALVHMSLVSSYVPAASKILLIELSAIAAVNSPTVLADTSLRCRPCSATPEAVVMTGPEGVLTTIVDSAPGELGAVGDRPFLSTEGEGCQGGLFGERLKDRCTGGGGCGRDGNWARTKGVHCGSQPTLPREEREPELLGCRCAKASPMALLASPFEHCHTRFGPVSAYWDSSGAQCGVEEERKSCKRKGKMQPNELSCNSAHVWGQMRSENRHGDTMVHSCLCGVVATCSASNALSLSGLPELVGLASRLASLTAMRESCIPSCRLLLIVGTGRFRSEQSLPTQLSSQLGRFRGKGLGLRLIGLRVRVRRRGRVGGGICLQPDTPAPSSWHVPLPVQPSSHAIAPQSAVGLVRVRG